MTFKHSNKTRHKATFSDQDLSGKSFRNSDLRGAEFIRSNLYKADFSGTQLYGADFTDANLREANFTNASVEKILEPNNCSPFSINFSGAQIQGTDFTNAKLNKAKFHKTEAGLTHRYSFFVKFCTFLICLCSSFSSAIAGTFAFYYFSDRHYYRKPSLFIFIFTWFLSVVFTVTLRTLALHIPILIGSYAIRTHMLFGMGLIAITIVLVGGITWGRKKESKDDSQSNIGLIIIIVILVLTMLVISLQPSLFKGYEYNIIRQFPALGIIVKGLGETTEGKWVAGIIGAALGGILGGGFSYLAIQGDKGFSLLWEMYVKFAAGGGTIFSGTDLTDANFSDASLKGAKFESNDSNIEKTFCKRTRWDNVRGFQYVSIEGHGYLNIPKVQQLVIKQQVGLYKPDDRIFDGLDLESINLEGATLSTPNGQRRASFVGTNFANANLRGVDFKRANLINTNFCGTDLTGAKLTGAIIKSWQINGDTKLDDIECDFIFLSDSPDENGIQQKVPHGAQKFQQGEFKSYIIDDMGTLQLFIPDDVNRQALAAAFLELVRYQGIAVANFQGIEKAGSNVKVKIQVPENTNQGIIEQEFARTSQSSATISKAQDSQKDPDLQEINENLDINQTQSLFEFVLKLIELIGEKMGRRIYINGDGSYIELNGGDYIIHGNYINTSQDLTQAAAQIQELLQQLQQKQPNITEEEATNKVAEDLANQAQKNETIREKLKNWGASLASETANELIVSSVIRVACGIAGIPL